MVYRLEGIGMEIRMKRNHLLIIYVYEYSKTIGYLKLFFNNENHAEVAKYLKYKLNEYYE